MKNNTTSSESRTDFARLDAMTDEDVDFSDLPEVTPEMFARGVVTQGLKPHTKTQLTLRLDSDVVEWFKQQGRGYQTRMNALLRAYMEESKAREGYQASAAQWANGESRGLTKEERLAAETRLFQHIGAVSLGYPLGSDNESIDTDLAWEYRAIREDPD